MQKIMIVSDTHGNHGNLEVAVREEAPFDLLIHLGDLGKHGDYIEAFVDCTACAPVEMLSGNNDFRTGLPGKKEITIGKWRAFITHGHTQYVSLGTGKLVAEAKRRGVDIAMYGHTHMPLLEEEDGITLLCPGSIAEPRQEGRRASYAIMTIEDDESYHIEIKYQ